ncbi:hypothetical protein SAMN05421736_1581, partial [Evansella caseinilytica]
DEQVINGTAETRGEWFGYAAGVIALSVAGDKGLSKLGNAAKLSRLGRLAGAAGLKAEHAVKLYLMNVQTRALNAVNTIVPTFGLNPALAGVPYNAINSMKMLDDLVDVNKANMMKAEQLAAGAITKATKNNYRKLFLAEYPDLPKGWQVHHSLPQKYETIMKNAGINIHEVKYLRGVDPTVHREITKEWIKWDKSLGRDPTSQEISDFAKQIDQKYNKNWH